MKHPVSRELFAYWDQLRGIRAAPERGDLDPAAIRSILADTFVLEVVEAGASHRDFPVRLSGTRLNALFMNELKSRSLLSFWQGSSRAALVEILACVLDDRRPVVAGAQAAPRAHAPVDLEMLLLPLRHHGKTHERILGSLAPAHVPSWLGLVPAEPLTLTTFRAIEGPSSRRAEAAPARRLPAIYGAPAQRGRFTVHQGGRSAPDSSVFSLGALNPD